LKKNDKLNKSVRKLLILFVNFVLLYALLRIIIELGERMMNPMIYYIGSMAYMLSAAGIIIAYFILNGYTFNREFPKWDDLPSNKHWTDERKAEFLRRLPERRAKAKQLLYVLLPILVTIFISYIELFLIG